MTGTIEQICDPTSFPLDEAIHRAKFCAISTPLFDLQVLHYVQDHCLASRIHLPVIFRGLEVLGALMADGKGDPNRVVTLIRPFLKSRNPQIASKAVLVLGRYCQNISWIRSAINETDQRIRANLVESLWNRTDPGLECVFQSALQDSHPRVVANAVYGLLLRGSPRWQAALNRMIKDSHPAFRRSAIWVLKMADDPAASAKLQMLIHDPDATVRTAAFSAVKHLRGKKQGLVAA